MVAAASGPSAAKMPELPALEDRRPAHYRIMCVGETWLGSDARAAFAAFRRLGHSIQVIDQSSYMPIEWQGTASRAIRRLCRALFVRELTSGILQGLSHYRPHCLFVFKGNWVQPRVIQHCRDLGIIGLNYYPDVSFLSHGPYIPRALPLYRHVFNSKSFGVDDMRSLLGITNVSFLAPGYDPELHRPLRLTAEERGIYECDLTFIGTWSPKKETILASLRKGLPEPTMKIWGSQWDRCRDAELQGSIMGTGVIGEEYTKAICGSSICLGLLSETGRGASSGDLITARTFQIPACGTFMLHERNREASSYFQGGRDAEFFSSSEELRDKVKYYLSHVDQREAIARNGLLRSTRDGYSIDHRIQDIVHWLDRETRDQTRIPLQ